MNPFLWLGSEGVGFSRNKGVENCIFMSEWPEMNKQLRVEQKYLAQITKSINYSKV